MNVLNFPNNKKPEDVPEQIGTTSTKALSILEGKSNETNEKYKIAGQKIEVPEKALANLRTALSLVTNAISNIPNLVFNPNDVIFKQLDGSRAGESTSEGTFVDPILLLHPAMRLAHVITHEVLHDNNNVPNEGLVDGLARNFFRDSGVLNNYDVDVENLIELSKGFNADQQTAMIEIYSLYSDQKFDKMYNKYLEYNQFGSDFFFKVFPELTFANVGSEGVVEMNNTITREKVLEEIQPLAKAA